jgi:hypothetical protein
MVDDFVPAIWGICGGPLRGGKGASAFLRLVALRAVGDCCGWGGVVLGPVV